MAGSLDQSLHLLPNSNMQHDRALEQLDVEAAYPHNSSYQHDMVSSYNMQFPSQGAFGTVKDTQPPTTPGRLTGEPAFCSGRHCCQWTSGGYVCNNHYASAADLDRHVATDHAGRLPNRQPSGDYHCYWAGCTKGESFGNKPKLTRHIHSHTGHKPHPCLFPGCGKGFVTKEQLKNHETTHTKTKEHVCPECGKGFAVKTALTSHMNVHKGAKPYICEECGKGFADSSNLSKHKAIHKRLTARRHRHHVHRASVSTTASSSMFSPPPFPAGLAGASGHCHTPIQSVESFESDAECTRACYDDQCRGQYRIPCRSASPCKSAACNFSDCSPATFDHCEVPCDLPDCEPCIVPDCDSCDLPHCDLPDCTTDCLDPFCTEQYNEFRTPHESGGKMPSEHAGLYDEIFDTSHGASSLGINGHYGGVDEEGFKQLRDFLANDLAGTMPPQTLPRCP